MRFTTDTVIYFSIWDKQVPHENFQKKYEKNTGLTTDPPDKEENKESLVAMS